MAAVADWRPAQAANKKLKVKDGDADAAGTLKLVENPDILATLSRKKKHRPDLVIGFAAETHDVEAYARKKLKRKRCDWIIANDVSGDIMGGRENEVTLVTPDRSEAWSRMSKDRVAEKLADRIAEHFRGQGPAVLAAE